MAKFSGWLFASACAFFLAACGGGEAPATKTSKPLFAPVTADAQLPKLVLVPPTGTGSTTTTSSSLLTNGTFESGGDGWTASAEVLSAGGFAHAGTRYAWLGGYDSAFDRLSQPITIPAGATSASLRFWYLIDSFETVPGAWDGMEVDVNDTAGNNLAILKLYTNQDQTSGWVQSQEFSLTAFAGRTVVLQFTAVTDDSASTSFLLDDITVSATLPAGTSNPSAGTGITLAGNRGDYDITPTGTGAWQVTERFTNGGRTTIQTYQAGQRLNFADSTVALGATGVPAQTYRLYQAAFNRQPDASGLGYQISAVEDSGLSLSQVAQNFINSPEFASRYGSLSDSQFVTQLYNNVLHRAPDASGLAYHVGRLASGTARRDVLIGFSESPENKDAVAPSIAAGIAFTPLNRPTTPATCSAPKVMQNGVCVTPPPVCGPLQVVQNGVCVTPPPSCVPPAVLQNGTCVIPTITCEAGKVLQNGLCVPVVTTCTAPQVLQNGICVTPPPPPPPPPPTCAAGQVLSNNVCTTPAPNSCPAGQILTNGQCITPTVIPPLRGSVVLEKIVFGKQVAGVPDAEYFAWGGLPSYYPVLSNNLGEVVSLYVCFSQADYQGAAKYPDFDCVDVPDFKPNTSVKVKNPEQFAYGDFKVYVRRAPAFDPSQSLTLVGTYHAGEWGFVPINAPKPCVRNGTITDPNCGKLTGTPPDPTPTTPPTAPPPPAGGGTGAGHSAQACVSTSRSADKVTLTNNCGADIFVMWCGDLSYSGARCGSTVNYYTHSNNLRLTDTYLTQDIYVPSGGSFRFGACYGTMSFSNNGNWQAWADGSYVCLK